MLSSAGTSNNSRLFLYHMSCIISASLQQNNNRERYPLVSIKVIEVYGKSPQFTETNICVDCKPNVTKNIHKECPEKYTFWSEAGFLFTNTATNALVNPGLQRPVHKSKNQRVIRGLHGL